MTTDQHQPGTTGTPVGVAHDFWDRLPFDVRDPAFHADPYPSYERLRTEGGGPVVRLPDGVLVVTGHRACVTALGDERLGFGPLDTETQSFLMVDPPEHRRLRTRVAAPFAARAVDRLRPAIEHRAAELLAAVDRAAEVDVIADLAEPLALDVICALVGVPPAEREEWVEALSWMVTGFDPESLRDPRISSQVACARLDFARHLRGLAERRRAVPAGDFVSALVAPGPDGTLLTLEQVVTAVGQVVIAGYEPTVNLIANGFHALLSHPRQLEHLRARPRDAPAAVEELLRYNPPIQLLTRVALRDADIDGTPAPAGTVVGLLVGAANRDPAAYDRPHRLDITRPRQHLSLGWGEHFCLGARLVRVQAEVMLTALARCRAVSTGEPVRFKPTLISRGLERLPVVLTDGRPHGP
ncbi:cytochrome P450 [Streptomyces sp. AV19]|uniref:cytochrome P450 n=1 Tax=Streptomyces sp. AV19 TaxID=2793068 RepID=UPI0018FEF1D8|nr:cytochrome P450 [Streptomyces sp. AV19]MBH1935808.1 cytochrome P450 [Streptomyces sp. AV19]MDG4536110.1 cytochrome P450 [Streptomyces sp. AV19]